MAEPEKPPAASTDFLQSLTPFKRDLFVRSVFSKYRSITQVDQPLFHYTSPDAFAKIVQRGAIWVSNTAYLNDQGELTYPISLARRVLRELWEREKDPSAQSFIESIAR